MQNIKQEQLHALAKSFCGLFKERPVSPQLAHEEELLMEIAKISDYETACKARDLFHSSKNVYDFNTYLYWLSELILILERGTSPDKAFDLVRSFIEAKYQEPLAIFKGYI